MKKTFTQALDGAFKFTVFALAALIAIGYFEGRFDLTEVVRLVLATVVFIAAYEIIRIRGAVEDMNKRKE